MIKISNFKAEKYNNDVYTEVEEGIYKITDNFDFTDMYVTSLSFVQEPELGEGSNASMISQYPLEDILDKFCVNVSDFYDELNTSDSEVCYQEFSGFSVDDIKKLRSIIGKHVYNKEEEGKIKLIIEN